MKRFYFILILVATIMTGCTDNQRAKAFGGTMTVNLEENEVLVNATWKEAQLWILVKDTTTNQLEFREYSSFGLVEGKVVFK
jgi:hypothetical protein